MANINTLATKNTTKHTLIQIIIDIKSTKKKKKNQQDEKKKKKTTPTTTKKDFIQIVLLGEKCTPLRYMAVHTCSHANK